MMQPWAKEGVRQFHVGFASRAGNSQMAFPCLDALDNKTTSLESGPEPAYQYISSGYNVFHSNQPLLLDHGGVLGEYDIAYETWGSLNADKSNAILLHTGLSASSHAKSHPRNPKVGWWEKFIGPGGAIDTDKFYIICANVLGGCYGSTGPSSSDPSTGQRYATRFPILTIDDMVRSQLHLLSSLEITDLYASVGASMGGMQSLSAALQLGPKVRKLVSISGCARTHPYSIAMRHTQRQVLMADPHWKRGFYYNSVPPHIGMKLAREIATITYRSGPEWEKRFGRTRADPSQPPAFCPDFLIETYLDHQGEKFCLEYDANSLLYVSKAMDMFDLSFEHQQYILRLRRENAVRLKHWKSPALEASSTVPDIPYTEKNSHTSSQADEVVPDSLVNGLSPLKHVPALVLGVKSDLLFPSWQQKEIYEALRAGGNESVTYVELSEQVSQYGHDTFLLDLEHVGVPLRQFLNH